MAKGYTLTMSNLTEDEFRKARARIIAEEYKKRTADDQTTSRHIFMTAIALEIGVTFKCVRKAVHEAGLPTSLPNYVNCGVKKAVE